MKDPDSSPFFVGYLEMPAVLRKFYIPLTLLMLLFSAMVGFTIASLQSSDAEASWQTDSTVTMAGFLQVDPYPVLHRMDPEDPDQIESILLVNQGKYSAEEFARPSNGQMVVVTGFPISRGGWTMLEIRSAVDIVQQGSGNANDESIKSRVKDISLGTVTLTGEIADSKCFLGVMKPGEGSVHKACAEVCLLGGIPSMLVVRDRNDIRYGYILTLPDGSSASVSLSERAADEIEISGELLQKGDLLYLKMAKDGVQG